MEKITYAVHNFLFSLNIIGIMGVKHTDEVKIACIILIGEHAGMMKLEKPRRRWEDNITDCKVSVWAGSGSV